MRRMARYEEARAVVAFWQQAGAGQWFGKDPSFDAEFRARFLDAHERIEAGEREAWLGSPVSALALVLLTDQFPRNAFRGTPRMYRTDARARRYAEAAIAAGFDERIPPELKLFFYLPFAHSEDILDQERSVALHAKLGYTANARRHRDIVRRFGRFPHRNAILARASTAEERAYLAAGGFAG